MLNEEILEKIENINKLLLQINNYWTRFEITKASEKKEYHYHYFKINVSVYTFLEEATKENDNSRIVHILQEEFDLNKENTKFRLDYLENKIKELIPNNNEND